MGDEQITKKGVKDFAQELFVQFTSVKKESKQVELSKPGINFVR